MKFILVSIGCGCVVAATAAAAGVGGVRGERAGVVPGPCSADAGSGAECVSVECGWSSVMSSGGGARRGLVSATPVPGLWL